MKRISVAQIIAFIATCFGVYGISEVYQMHMQELNMYGFVTGWVYLLWFVVVGAVLGLIWWQIRSYIGHSKFKDGVFGWLKDKKED